MSCPQEARNDPNRLEPVTITDTDRYDVTDIQEGGDKTSHYLAFSKSIQQDSMNKNPSFNCELQIGRRPCHDLAFSSSHQENIKNREPSCNLELSQNIQPSDTQINSETTFSVTDSVAVTPPEITDNVAVTPPETTDNVAVTPPESGATDYQLKVIFLGDVSVGKTSLIIRFMYNSYSEQCPHTISIDSLDKIILLHGRTVRLQLWDTAGQERFQSVIVSYIRNSSIAVVVYDITDRKSFEAVDGCVRQVREVRHDNVAILIVGNKVDLQDNRQVLTEEGTRKAQELRADFVETSAKTGCNVEELLTRVVLGFIDVRDYPTNSHQIEAIQLPTSSQSSVESSRHCCSKCCC